MQQVNFLKKVITFLFTITLSSQVFAAQWGSETGQYVTDKADRVDRIEHPAVDTFSMIDFLMCITNIRPDLYPNSNFKALVDEGACEAISGNADPSSTVTKYAELWNSCTRASNTAPQICKGWFLASDGAKYLAEVTATTAPTDARPNGEFTMTYCKANEASGECPVLASSEGRGQLSVSVDTSGASDVTVFQLIDAYVDEQAGALTEKLYASSSFPMLFQCNLIYDSFFHSPYCLFPFFAFIYLI